MKINLFVFFIVGLIIWISYSFVERSHINYLLNSDLEQAPKSFEFNFQWSSHGRYSVFSEDEKRKDGYGFVEETKNLPIKFTFDERNLIWNQLLKMDFFSYPDHYSPRGPIDTIPEETRQIVYSEDSSVVTDYTTYHLKPDYQVDITSHSIDYHMTVYYNKQVKSMHWEDGQTLSTFNGNERINIIDPKYAALLNFSKFIGDIILSKQEIKDLGHRVYIYH